MVETEYGRQQVFMQLDLHQPGVARAHGVVWIGVLSRDCSWIDSGSTLQTRGS